MPDIYIDGDACPVKEEVLKVAARHGLTVMFVSNRWSRKVDAPNVRQVIVGEGFDAADNWIAENIGAGDIAVTADIPLASRCLKAGAQVLGPTGRPFTEHSIGMALAMRDLNAHLRETGEIKGYNASFTRQDRSRFLEELEKLIRKALRDAP
ncbi:MAG: YaiI/YqxD family protein [Sphingomonadales bacterium]